MPSWITIIVLSGLAVAGSHHPAMADSSWRRGLVWQGRSATAARDGTGYRLVAAGKQRSVPMQTLRTETASVLFDGLFALAQQELEEAKVAQIADAAFDHGRPAPCDCFETGEKWTYVWTRDSAYAIDLALAGLDPARARRTLEFKLSAVREPAATNGPHVDGSYVVQDTGSGGSWPISTDRVAWFLGARHLLDDAAFAQKTYQALVDTLAQDRRYAFDPRFGLYRGETSFLDWREQSYPRWTANDVGFIAESFALSTNVLHYDALRLAQRMASRRGDAAAAAGHGDFADQLRGAIERHFWREDRGLYMSYIGVSGGHAQAIDSYDLLGIALAALSDAVAPERARRALANYPIYAAGSPAIWPERSDVPIYHNRAIWPFVSTYALKAARALDYPQRIADEVRSLMRGAALAGSNMENYELAGQAVHVEDGALSGPVVNSRRQLWSVAGYLDMVIEGVFGVSEDGRIEPKLPVELVPMLFGERRTIQLQLRDRRITLVRPATLSGDLLVAGAVREEGADRIVELRARKIAASPLRRAAPMFAPNAPPPPRVQRAGNDWRIDMSEKLVLYVNGARRGEVDSETTAPYRPQLQCFSVTRRGENGLESLPSPDVCVGERMSVDGAWPRTWTAPRSGRFQVALKYDNPQGPINTGVTAAVKRLSIRCEGHADQSAPLVMPHSVGERLSTAWTFDADLGKPCRFALDEGFNMSMLRHFERYSAGVGGERGALNTAQIGELSIVAVDP